MGGNSPSTHTPKTFLEPAVKEKQLTKACLRLVAGLAQRVNLPIQGIQNSKELLWI